MRNLITLFLVALVTACGTITADRTDTAKQQVAEATSAWVAAYNSVILRVSSRCMTPKQCFGERRQKLSLQIRLQLLSISRMPAKTQKRELLSANSIFGYMVMWP